MLANVPPIVPVLGAVRPVMIRSGLDGTGVEHGFSGEWLLRGAGEPIVKSARLLLVSVQPPVWRIAAVVLLRAPAAVPSAAFALPYPTKSIIDAPDGTETVKAVELFTSATLPSVALRLIVPEASGVGSEADPPLPCAS